MAIRVQNSEVANFGALAAETVITHGRIGFGTETLAVRPLTTPRTVAAGGQAEFAIGEIDIVFPSNELSDGGYSELLALYFARSVWIDAMTDDSTVVAAVGYSQQTSSNWGLTQEND